MACSSSKQFVRVGKPPGPYTQNIVELDNDKKAALVGNLLVVLCSDRGTQPIISASKPA